MIPACKPEPTETTRSIGNIREIAESEFDSEIAKSSLPVVAEIYAPWCGACKTLAPILEKQADDFSGRMTFLKINLDQAPNLSRRYNIQGVPTLLLFKNGKLADTILGVQPPEELQRRFDALGPGR